MLKPFFCYYGGKWRVALRYPKPMHATIVEPFAGAAGYATRYHEHQVVLCESNPMIRALWQYLISVPASEIRRLPANVWHTDDALCCEEAKYLIGFWLNKGTSSPRKTPGKWMRQGYRPKSHWGVDIRDRIASQVDAIRHWRVLSDYRDAPDIAATWFVDPPYSNAAGKHYRHSAVDYNALGEWCMRRQGQVLVCENEGATWLPFAPFANIKASTVKGRTEHVSREVLFSRNSIEDLL